MFFEILGNIVFDLVFWVAVFLGIYFLGAKWKDLGFRFDWKKDIVGALFLLGKLFLALLVVAFALSFFSLNDLELVGRQIEKIPLWMMFYFLTVRVFTEEVFFRAFLIRFSNKIFKISEKVAAFGSSLIFGLAHYSYGSKAEVIGAFVLGLVLSFDYLKSRSIIRNFLAHFLYNVMIFILLTMTRTLG